MISILAHNIKTSEWHRQRSERGVKHFLILFECFPFLFEYFLFFYLNIFFASFLLIYVIVGEFYDRF